MIRRLIILLLIVGCGTEPEDCAGVEGGIAVVDDCGVCDGIDGYVAGSCYDCANTPNGDAVEDNCGTCDNNSTNDCAQDNCGIWGGDDTPLTGTCDCTGAPNGNTMVDCAGICGGSNSTTNECGLCGDHNACINAEQITIEYNIHESLPIEWINEFYTIMDRLIEIIPTYKRYLQKTIIYAWNDNIDDPYQGIEGGIYVGGSSLELPVLVLEMGEGEFNYNATSGSYSAIPHEYFHIYQRGLAESMNKYDNDPSGINIKWIIEGPAESFELLYKRQFYNENYWSNSGETNINNIVHTNPSALESYDSQDTDQQYTSSVYLTLVLVKELIASGLSEEEAFRKIYKIFLLQNPTNETWKAHFENVFNFSVNDFYDRVKTYNGVMNDVSPSQNLKLENIF